MPYIRQHRRNDLAIRPVAMDAGELNFLFTDLIIQYLEQHGVSYQRINDVVGALEGAKLEFYRRIVQDYEDTKIAENGDVYDTL